MSTVPLTKGQKKKKKKNAAAAAAKNLNQVSEPPKVTSSSCGLVKLPEKSGEKTYFNEVEVTMTESKGCEINIVSDSKKKDKSRKECTNALISETVPKDTAVNALAGALCQNDNIGRKNRPEITLIPATNVFVDNKSPVDVVPQQPAEDGQKLATSKKKKKKKKKNNSVSESSEHKPNSERSCSEPTYVKLPADGDACVLVVSHESFGGNSDASKQPNSSVDVVDTVNVGSIEANRNSGPKSNYLPFAEAEANGKGGPRNHPVNSVSIILKSNAPSPENCSGNAEFPELPCNKPPPCKNAQGIETPEQPSGKDKNAQQKKKAENQALKEVNRITKMAKKQCESSENVDTTSQKPQGNNSNMKLKVPKQTLRKAQSKASGISFCSHLQSYKTSEHISKLLESNLNVHPAIAAVGVQCSEGIITGSDARCISVLAALEEVIRSYETPANKELSRELEAKLEECISFVGKCRPPSVSMVNAVTFLKQQITNIPSGTSDFSAKTLLLSQIKKFVKEEICLAKEAISNYASNKIVDGDVILTYAYSSVVEEVLQAASRKGKKFRVVVVDSMPQMEGREMLRCLLKSGIQCTYTLISGLSFVMKGATKIFIGAHSLLANGYVMSRIGSSQIALVASSYNVPFLVCCETYKFWERVHTDSFDYNELGNPTSFVDTEGSGDTATEDQKGSPQLQYLNLLYDITPPNLVSMVITEKGMLPCTSVPVLLRVRQSGSLRE